MSFRTFGQNETLISSIRNIIKDYPPESIFKEFLQNADDAGATRFHIIVDDRIHPAGSLFCNKMKSWQGPAIYIFNNARFKDSDFESLMQIRVGGKQGDNTKIGKHGLGFNSCYHFTDVPSFISGDSVVFLDPLEKFLPVKDGRTQRGTIGPIPKKGIKKFREKDQLVPFEGIEGINFRSTFNGTLFRIPLRQQPSEISDNIFTTSKILNLIKTIKMNFSSQLLFLRNIETMEISYIPYTTSGPSSQISFRPLWKATIKGLNENVRDQRKRVTDSIFQIEIEAVNSSPNEKQNDLWIIVTDSQQNPERLRKYAEQHRLRVSGGVAALLKSSKSTVESNFVGRMYSFFQLSDTTHLPVHLNGTWAQSSDRGKLLIESDELPDLDRDKLEWNRHIMLEFLPKLYSKLLKEIVRLRNNGSVEFDTHPISKFWPFPPSTRNYPKYAIEYGCKVLQYILRKEENFWSDSLNETSSVDSLFYHLPYDQVFELHKLFQSNWGEIATEFYHNPDLKTLIRLLPIWPTLSDPLQPPGTESILKPAICGYTLPKSYEHYRTKNSKIYFEAKDDTTRQIFFNLGVPERDIYSYTFEDIEFPTECNYHYLNFLNSILKDPKIVYGLKDKRCFPTLTDKLKKISDLYDYNNEVFRIVFSGNSDMFLRLDLMKHAESLSNIGFKNKITQEIFVKCAMKIEELQKVLEPPSDIRYRGFILINHLYKHINVFDLESIMRIRFVPVSKVLGKPYSINYDRPQALYRFDDIILPKYREIAWSQMSLIAEDVIPPDHVLQRCPSLGKPDAYTVVRHLRFLYSLLDNREWRTVWDGTFKHNVFEVYKWLEEECLNDEELDLSKFFEPNERLFLNFKKDQEPFNINNWFSAKDLVLNSEPEEEKYVHPDLAKYPTMLKSAGAGEVIRPDIEIHVRERNASKNPMFEFLIDQEFPLNETIFIVNGENIKTSRYTLAVSYEFFRRKFASPEPDLRPIIINDAEPSSVHILIRYLYGQNVDDAIKSLSDHDDTSDTVRYSLYKDLLKLAGDYELDHLKESMEFRLSSRFVNGISVNELKKLAEVSKARQLENFCNQFIHKNGGVKSKRKPGRNDENPVKSKRRYTRK